MSEVYLFRSYAYGTPSESSDIDLCIIADDHKSRKRDLVLKIRKSITKATNILVDILLYRNSEFYDRADLPFSLEFKIKNTVNLLNNRFTMFFIIAKVVIYLNCFFINSLYIISSRLLIS